MSAEQGFQRRIYMCIHESAFTPMLNMRFIKLLPSFAQTSLEAFSCVKRGWGGLTFPAILVAHYLFTYTPIFFFAAHLQNTLSIKQVRAPRDDGSDVNYDESYNEPYDNSAEVFIIDHPPSSSDG